MKSVICINVYRKSSERRIYSYILMYFYYRLYLHSTIQNSIGRESGNHSGFIKHQSR